MSHQFFRQLCMEFSIYCIFFNKLLGRLFKNLTFQGRVYAKVRLIKRGVYLQIHSIVNIAFFFDKRQAMEKTTNLHYNLFICFILNHIHSSLASSSLEEEINGFRTSLLSTKIDSLEFSFCPPASQGCSFFLRMDKVILRTILARIKPQHLNGFIMFSLDS